MTTSTPNATPTRQRCLPRSILVTIGLWALVTLAIFLLSQGALPFHLPLYQAKGTPYLGPIIGSESTLLVALAMIGLIYLVTARRAVPDMAARAPAIAVARAETLGLVGYGIVAQIGGALLGHVVGHYAISLHMPGTIFGLSGPYTPREAIVWASYNFVAYAVLPFAYFRWRRGYTREQLNLRSNNLRADILLIVVVLIAESIIELTTLSSAIFSLSGTQLVFGVGLTFVLYFFGTVLPIMIFIYSILLPRYLKLTNSVALTIILGGLTYAAVHVGDSWGPQMRRVASSICHGTVSASLLMRKLAAYPRQNQVARALTEMGKLERTAFLLEYFRDEALRRRVLIGLNKGEALHALARQLFFGRLGELRDRAFEDQMHRASCLHLLMAAIAAWNTVYLTKAIATLRKRGEDIPEATVAHIAPLGWEHIRLIGDYHFAPQSGRSLENLRPLRLQEGEESI